MYLGELPLSLVHQRIAALVYSLKIAKLACPDVTRLIAEQLKHSYRYEVLHPAAAFDLAAEEGNLEVIKDTYADKEVVAAEVASRGSSGFYLRDFSHVNAFLNKPLEIAVSKGYVHIVRWMLELGNAEVTLPLLVNAWRRHHHHCMTIAIRTNNIAVLEYLLEYIRSEEGTNYSPKWTYFFPLINAMVQVVKAGLPDRLFYRMSDEATKCSSCIKKFTDMRQFDEVREPYRSHLLSLVVFGDGE